MSGPSGVVLAGIILFLGMTTLASVEARPTREAEQGDAAAATEHSELRGRVRLVGSEPFARLVISTGEGRDYYLEDDDARQRFARYIGREVRARGQTGFRELQLVGSDRTVREYYIKELEIGEITTEENE